MFKYFKKKAIEERIEDELLYEYVLEEIENNSLNKGLWAKALARANGDNKKVNSLYLKFRVQSIKDAFNLLEIDYSNIAQKDLFNYINTSLFKNLELKKKHPSLSLQEIKEKEKEEKIKERKKENKKELINFAKNNNSIYIEVFEDVNNYGYTLLSKDIVRKEGTWNDYKIKRDNDFIFIMDNEKVLDSFYLKPLSF